MIFSDWQFLESSLSKSTERTGGLTQNYECFLDSNSNSMGTPNNAVNTPTGNC